MGSNRSAAELRDATTPLLDGPDDWGVFVEPYWRAAEKVLDAARNDSFLIHPGLFLMRHYVELFMKRQLQQSGLKVPITHDLKGLWSQVRALDSVTSNPHITPNALASLDQAITNLAKIDPNGETFRYPVDTDGKPRGLDGTWFSARHSLEWSREVQTQLALLQAAVDMQAMDRDAEREIWGEYGPGPIS